MGKSKQYKDQEVPKLSVSEPLTEYCSSIIGKDAKRINLTEKTNWVSQFAGKWNDSRPVDDIIEDIRSSRSANKEIEL